MLPAKSRWAKQPSGLYLADTQGPFGRGLLRVWNHSALPTEVDAAGSGKVLELKSSVVQGPGHISYATATGSDPNSADGGEIAFSGLTGYSVLSVAMPVGTLVARQALWSLSGGGTLGFGAGYSTPSQAFAYTIGNGSFLAEGGTGTFVSGERAVYICTYSNAASTTAVVYKNGRVAHSGTPSGVGAVATATYRFRPGGGKITDSELLTWQGRIWLTAVWNRALSAAEAAAVSSNPWQLFQPRRIWVPVTAGAAGDASVALSGASATSAAGTLIGAAGASAALSGASSTSSAGTVTASVGTNAAVTLDGAGTASSAGTLAAAAGAAATLAGATTTAAAGTLVGAGTSADATVALVGTSATASAGVLGAEGDPIASTGGGGLPVWLAREVRKKLRERQEQEAALEKIEAEPAPQPAVQKKAAKVAAVLAPMAAPKVAPAVPQRVQVDVVPMARDWLAEWTQRHGVRLAPAAYAELIDVASSAMVGVPHDFAAPMIDQRSMQAAIQQYETARRQQEDELLMMM